MSNPNAGQAAYWNSDAGQKWIANEEAMDAALAGILHRLVERVDIHGGEKLLDVGCGTGESTRYTAAAVGSAGHVTGIDISPRLLNRAREKSDIAGLENTRFLLADAQTHNFKAKSCDAILSRFGVMFFSDPVAAFKNMAKALKPNGRMMFAAWGALEDNLWFRIPREAAVAHLGEPPVADPYQPGPTAFQDIERVVSLMEQAGLRNVRGEAEVVPMVPMGSVFDAARLASKVGPASRIIKEFSGTEHDSAVIEKLVAEAFAGIETDGKLVIDANINFFSASGR